jgi:tetratricopeptide (TPR) repeat protein
VKIPAKHILQEFVDRTREVAGFERLLSDSTGDFPRRIMCIYGPGGTGKSVLLSRMMAECELREIGWVYIEWEDSRRYNYLDVMRMIRDSTAPHLFHLFNDRVNFYTVHDYNLKIPLEVGTIQDVQVLSNGEIQQSGVTIHVGHEIKDFTVNILRPDRDVTEGEVIIECTRAFMRCLHARITKKPLVIFFDALEKADEHTVKWIWAELLERLRDQEITNLLVILAGRNPFEPDATFFDCAEEYELMPFQVEHIIEYLGKRGAEALFQDLSAPERPPPLAGHVQFYRGRILEAQGMWQQAEQVYQAYLKSQDKLNGNAALLARCPQRLAETYLSLGDLKRAETHAGTSLKINQKSGDRFGEAGNFEILGGIYEKLRDRVRAQGAFEESFAILDKVSRRFDKARIYSDLAALYLSFDNWADAEHYYQAALQVKVDAGDNYGLAFIYSNLGQLYLKRGDNEAALRHFHTSLTVFQQFKDGLNAAKVFRHLAIAYERMKDIPSALDHMRKAEQHLSRDSALVTVYQEEIQRLERFMPGKDPPREAMATVIGIIAAVILFLVLLVLHILTIGEE